MDKLDEPIILDCDECGRNTVFGPDGLESHTRIICPSCYEDYSSVAEILAIKKAVAKSLQDGIGQSLEDSDGVKFTKDNNILRVLTRVRFSSWLRWR
jgi:uncharacterized Zn ribbon protein